MWGSFQRPQLFSLIPIMNKRAARAIAKWVGGSTTSTTIMTSLMDIHDYIGIMRGTKRVAKTAGGSGSTQ